MATVTCLYPKKVKYKPGTILPLWGHKFVVHKNGDAIAQIYKSTAEAGAAAGRYLIVSDKNDQASQPEQEAKSYFEFGMDIKNYYGAGDLDKLAEKLKTLETNNLIDFASKHFSIVLPPTLSREAIMGEIIQMVKIKDGDVNTAPGDAGIENEVPIPRDDVIDELQKMEHAFKSHSESNTESKPEPKKTKRGRPKKK